MEVVHPRCCGLEVPKETVVAGVLVATRPGHADQVVRPCGTTTAAVLALGAWLAAQEVSPVAMEATGVSWQPLGTLLGTLLEGRCALLLVNAAQVKAVPGRKTDVADSEWLADLLRHGLLRSSVVPPRPQRDRREVTRPRAHLGGTRTAAVNRRHKPVAGTNLTLGRVISDLTGVSGRAILAALLAGQTAPAQLAALAVGRWRAKLPALAEALGGHLSDQQRFLLRQHLALIDVREGQIAAVDEQSATRLAPQEDLVVRWEAIPGVGRRTAEVIAAEVGTDVTRFPRADHLTRWAGVCPGQEERAGQRRSGKTRKGTRALRAALCAAAKAAGRTKPSALGRRYRRLQERLGAQQATVAMARHILAAVDHMIKEGTPYREPTPTPRGPLARRADQRHPVQAREDLGFHVVLQPIAA